MNMAKDFLWRNVQPLLRDFAERIAAADSAVSYSVQSTSNDAYLIRGYVSLRKSAADDEIAVTVDAVYQDGEIVLSADACMDDGEVLADGPGGTMSLSELMSSSGMQLPTWLGRFKDFLTSIEAVVAKRIAGLYSAARGFGAPRIRRVMPCP